MSQPAVTLAARLPFPTFAVFCGIVGPLFLLARELDKRECGLTLFDPIPSIWHLLLILTVPVGTALTLVATRHLPTWRRPAAWVNGVAMVVAGLYAIWFILMAPKSGTLVIGVVIATLLVMLALLATMRCRSYLTAHQVQQPGLPLGLLVGLIVFLAAESPILITQVALRMTTARSEDIQARGLRILDSIGDERAMLHLCRGHDRYLGLLGGLLQSALPVKPAVAQRAYADVTNGLDYYSMPETIFTISTEPLELDGNYGN